MHKTFLIKPGQRLDQAEIAEHAKPPSYTFLRKTLNGYIETVPHLTSLILNGKRVRCIAYADEEGRLKKLPRNNEMSTIWKQELLRKKPKAHFSYEPELFGPVILIVNGKQLK